MNSPLPQERRRIHYIDHVLQKWLLVALVTLEAALTGAAIWGLYRVLGGLVDDNMYRIHFSADDDTLHRFLLEGARILAATGLVNLTALICADRIWAAYVQRIVRALDKVMHAAQRLDLRPQAGVRRAHAVLDQSLRWQRAESLRLQRIRYLVRRLPVSLPASAAARAEAETHLRAIHRRNAHTDDK